MADFSLDFGSDPSVLRLRDGEWETLAAVPLGTHRLVALSDESVMIANSRGCFQWADNTWQPVPHPVSESRSGRVEQIFGNTTGGIYSISSRHSIHYLDLGGTGLWQ